MGFLARCFGVLYFASSAVYADTTTTYTYNSDGALTAITVQRDGDSPTTSFLTWDNFEPDQENPASGTVMVGDGNLLGRGPEPGGTPVFGFDVRDRLLSQGPAASPQTYAYHANGMLADAILGDGRRQFYQDHSPHPQMSNIVENVDGQGQRTAARLGMGRYLSDGTDQVLLNPRKDVAGVLRPANASFAGIAYDPFGAPEAGFEPATSYNLTDPDLGYAGEYSDPAWGGIYLRARWYDPASEQFISRDPKPHLNRYGYGAGNPVMHIDPSGMTAFHSFGRDIDKLMSGKSVGDHFARFFLAPFLAPADIMANPKGFWQAIKHDKGGIDVFLAIGIATEFASIGLEGYGWSETIRTISVTKRIWGRRLLDLGLGTAQAITAGASHGFSQYDWSSFGASMELSWGALGWSHYVAGVGYHPYAMKGSDLIDTINELAKNKDDTAIIFRERNPQVSTAYGEKSLRVGYSSPLGEKARIGLYHEAVVVVTRRGIFRNELFTDATGNYGELHSDFIEGDEAGTALRKRAGGKARYQRVGSVESMRASTILHANPLNLLNGGKVGADTFRYSQLTNNCHWHANAVISSLLDPR